MMRLAVASLLLACSLALAACGFQLRGAHELPAEMEHTYVDYSGTDTGIRQETVRQLALNDVTIERNAANASAILELQRVSTRRDILSRDRQGRPQEYDVAIEIRFRLLDADGRELLPSRDIDVRSVLVLDTTDPLASRSELEAASRSLREGAVQRMIRMLAQAPAVVGQD